MFFMHLCLKLAGAKFINYSSKFSKFIRHNFMTKQKTTQRLKKCATLKLCVFCYGWRKKNLFKKCYLSYKFLFPVKAFVLTLNSSQNSKKMCIFKKWSVQYFSTLFIYLLRFLCLDLFMIFAALKTKFADEK